MLRRILTVIGGLLNIIWGIAHLLPTNSVVKGFGAISPDNTRIIRMEWINEGLTLLFIGLLAVLLTITNKDNNTTVKVVLVSCALMLFSMAVLSLFTGFNIAFLPFRLCPFIFSVSGLLLLQGALRK